VGLIRGHGFTAQGPYSHHQATSELNKGPGRDFAVDEHGAMRPVTVVFVHGMLRLISYCK
jgi:hypothetical protein